MPILFNLGDLTITPGVSYEVHPVQMERALDRHLNGDWGDVPTHLKLKNDEAVIQGNCIHSCYLYADGSKFWILTTKDRTATRIALDSEVDLSVRFSASDVAVGKR